MRRARMVALLAGLAVASVISGQALAGTPAASGQATSEPAGLAVPSVGAVGTLTVGGGEATVTPTDRAGNPTGQTVSEPQSSFAPSQSDLAAAQDVQGPAVIVARAPRRSPHAVAGCSDIDAWRYSTSFLFGTLIYKFHETVHYCWNTANKLTVVNTGTHISNVDPNWIYRGLTASDGYFFTWCCGQAQSGHYGLRQGHFDNCVLKYGCIGSEYPWVKIWIHGDGSWSYSTGQ